MGHKDDYVLQFSTKKDDTNMIMILAWFLKREMKVSLQFCSFILYFEAQGVIWEEYVPYQLVYGNRYIRVRRKSDVNFLKEIMAC